MWRLKRKLAEDWSKGITAGFSCWNALRGRYAAPQGEVGWEYG
jgi:hypothetical protein